MRKVYLLRVSTGSFLLCFLFGVALLFLMGCSETEIFGTLERGTHPEEEGTGEFIASVESWEYDPLGDYISIVIWVTNDSGEYVAYYEIYYRVDLQGEDYKRDFISGYRLGEGRTRKEYAHTKIGKEKEVSSVVVDDVSY